ncbi:hypothetical protein ACFFSY_23885 [Paenibacillus aurantiacus]|uniref:PIN domain-containing protein n=1 Tax=Paenibacillus aurantiacus TaxID=1936118 RepID=A0ABV5KY45_9BACL
MTDTRVRIIWDTNVFVQALIMGQEQILDYLDDLIWQSEQELIDLIVPKAVQAELYGILRAGRLNRINDAGEKVRNYAFSHSEVMYLLEAFPTLFDFDFLSELEAYAWPADLDYKYTLFAILHAEYGWSDWGQSVIETRLLHSVEHLGLKDQLDFPIMAAALIEGIDLLVSSNMKDFIDALGKIRVMKSHDARRFDHFSLHRDSSDYE